MVHFNVGMLEHEVHKDKQDLTVLIFFFSSRQTFSKRVLVIQLACTYHYSIKCGLVYNWCNNWNNCIILAMHPQCAKRSKYVLYGLLDQICFSHERVVIETCNVLIHVSPCNGIYINW